MSTPAITQQVYGLIALCDATQQIYLNPPLWQNEWHEKWEMKRQRLQAKGSVKQQSAIAASSE
jgi:hypothetical protein